MEHLSSYSITTHAMSTLQLRDDCELSQVDCKLKEVLAKEFLLSGQVLLSIMLEFECLSLCSINFILH